MDALSFAESEIRREFPPDVPEIRLEVADVFREYGADYRAKHDLSGPQLAAMEAIEKCRTSALGGHVDQCEHCGHLEISYNSCRNRNCPKCRGSQRSAWVDARELELLPIQYFHLIFTLPHILLGLARYNPQVLYGLLFQSAAETLQTFAQNRWGGKLGIIMVLHTWGQTLNDHPHVHCIVTGGVLKNDGSAFVCAPKNFLFPIRALSKVFRAKFLAALQRAKEKGKLDLRGQEELGTEAGWQGLLAKLRTKRWVVYAKHPFAEAQHLLRYLGRYVNRTAIANHRIQRIEDGQVTFTYLDNREPVEKVMRLSAEEFIRRFLAHIPPRQACAGCVTMASSPTASAKRSSRSAAPCSDWKTPSSPTSPIWMPSWSIKGSITASAPFAGRGRCAASTISGPFTARRREVLCSAEMPSFAAAHRPGAIPLRQGRSNPPMRPWEPPCTGALGSRAAPPYPSIASFCPLRPYPSSVDSPPAKRSNSIANRFIPIANRCGRGPVQQGR
jgi:hypothetical protein